MPPPVSNQQNKIKKSKPNPQPTQSKPTSKPTKSTKPTPPIPKSLKLSTSTTSQHSLFEIPSVDGDDDDNNTDSGNNKNMNNYDVSDEEVPQLVSINSPQSELASSESYRLMQSQLAQMKRHHVSNQREFEEDQKQSQKQNPKRPNPNNKNEQNNNDNNNNTYDDDSDSDELPLPPVPNPDCFNPFLEAYYIWLQSCPPDIERLFDPSLSDERRKVLIDFLPTRSQRQYAWAIPTMEAIQILYHFGPVIEIGAGKGYWGSLLRKYAAKQLERTGTCKVQNPNDIYVGFDCEPTIMPGDDIQILNLEYRHRLQQDKTAGFLPIKNTQKSEPMKYIKDDKHPSWTSIKIGDSNELKRPIYEEHTLFLCYPDDFIFSERSLAYDCLRKFKGQYIITVGEALGETRQENPWGRSADGHFQQHLADQFHKIAQIPLPSFHSSCDHLCVYKRTIKCVIDQTEEDEGIIFRYVPMEEKLAIRAFAPCLQDLAELTQNYDPDDCESQPLLNTSTIENNTNDDEISVVTVSMDDTVTKHVPTSKPKNSPTISPPSTSPSTQPKPQNKKSTNNKTSNDIKRVPLVKQQSQPIAQQKKK